MVARHDDAPELASFLHRLSEDGRAVVSTLPSPSAPDAGDAVAVLEQTDRIARDELTFELPAFQPEPALWAARLFRDLCRLTACRDLGEDEIQRACASACPDAEGPGAAWSVDLTLRHLPKLFELARHLSNADPLIDQLKRLAREWPLSSVGLPGLEGIDPGTIAGHAGLRRLYADRILAARDRSRLGHPVIDEMLRADLGAHSQLAPEIADALLKHEPD